MAAGDQAGLIEACARLGDVSRGGDPHLWTEVLQYFGSQQYDCSAQVIFSLLGLFPAHGKERLQIAFGRAYCFTRCENLDRCGRC